MEQKRYTVVLESVMDGIRMGDKEFHLWATHDLEAQAIAAKEAVFLSGDYGAGHVGCYRMEYKVKSIAFSEKPKGKYGE